MACSSGTCSLQQRAPKAAMGAKPKIRSSLPGISPSAMDILGKAGGSNLPVGYNQNAGKGGFWTGSPSQAHALPTVTPDQSNVLRYLMGNGLSSLMNPYQGFDPIQKLHTQQFMNQTVPSLAERFGSLGENQSSSPSFLSQIGQAGADLQTQLAALRSQYGMQNRGQALSQIGLGLSPQFQYHVQGAQPGALQGLIGGAARGLTSYMTGGLF